MESSVTIRGGDSLIDVGHGSGDDLSQGEAADHSCGSYGNAVYVTNAELRGDSTPLLPDAGAVRIEPKRGRRTGIRRRDDLPGYGQPPDCSATSSPAFFLIHLVLPNVNPDVPSSNRGGCAGWVADPDLDTTIGCPGRVDDICAHQGTRESRRYSVSVCSA